MDIRHIKQELLSYPKVTRRQMDLEAKKFAEYCTNFINDKLNQTIWHRSFGNPRNRPPGFEGARPKVKYKITKDSNGDYDIKITGFMSFMGTDTLHKVWHIIESGRKPYTAKRTQRWPIRFNVRTTPNSYTVQPFAGWSKEWVTVKKGGTVGGFEARKFYLAIAKDLREAIKRDFPTYKKALIKPFR